MENLPIAEYTNALMYCYITYFNRDVAFCLKEAFGDKDATEGKNKVFGDVDWSGINPVEQELRKKHRIPPKFENYLKRKKNG